MFYVFNSHPAPGFHADGSLVTVADKSAGMVKAKTAAKAVTAADCGGGGFGGGAGIGGGGSGGGGSGGFNSGFGGGGGGPGSGSGIGGDGGMSSPNVEKFNPVHDRLDIGSVVEDWIPRDASGLNEMFKLMYHRDHIAGTIVDLLAETIWSDFELTGIEDPSMRQVYLDSMQAIDPESTMPDVTREFLVIGRIASSLIFDPTSGLIRDIITHDPGLIRVTPIPIKGFDPKIDLIPSPALRMFMDSVDSRDVEARRILPEAFMHAVRTAGGGGNAGSFRSSSPYSPQGGGGMSGIPLDPINTLFLARRRFNFDYIGTSLFTRLITFWALEKALINATVTSARRRSRAVLHVKMGIDNVWEPSPEEMSNMIGMWTAADEDPVGAVVVTRTGVDAQELRSGTDFYKWADEWSLLNEGKLRALGANDALLSGDATYSNQESARNFFMERAAGLRDILTTRTFYNRLFPLIARLHGFRKRTQAQLSHGIRIESSVTHRDAMSIPQNELILPTIQWRKPLVNQFDEKRLEILDKMEEKGVPVLLRDWATAGNVELDAQVSGLAEDQEVRRQIAKWKAASSTETALDEAALEWRRSLGTVVAAGLRQSVPGDDMKELGPLGSYPFWSHGGTIGPLSAAEMAKFCGTINPDRSAGIVVDRMTLNHHLNEFFHNQVKAELAHFLIYRTGLTHVSPVLSGDSVGILAEVIKTGLDRHAGHGQIYKLGKLAEAELTSVAACSQTVHKAKLNKMSGSASETDRVVQKKMGYADHIPSGSSKLFSGV